MPDSLNDQLGIAIGKCAYKANRDLIASPRWQRAFKAGARPQRLLFASTGSKDPKADILYIKALAGPLTVNTMPEGTLKAFADHGEVSGILPPDGGDCQRCVVLKSPDRENVPVKYDYLILATGVRHSYFGHDQFEKFAPGLKSLANAVEIRNKVLRAFEQAETEEDVSRHRDLLTFVLIGGGPTGVEMAAAIAVLVRNSLRSEYRRIDPTSARIVLLDAAPRLLGSFSDSLSQAAKKRLELHRSIRMASRYLASLKSRSNRDVMLVS